MPKGVSLFSHTLRERLCRNYALLRKEGKHFFCAPSGAQFCFTKYLPKVLEESGYVIDTIPGRYGGYVLNKKYTFPSTRLSDAEKEGLMQGFDYLLSRNDFMRKDDYAKAMAKISAAMNPQNDEEIDTTVIYRYPDSMDENELSSRYRIMERCIKEQRKLSIDYRSNDNKIRTRIVHPYKLYMYNNS